MKLMSEDSAPLPSHLGASRSFLLSPMIPRHGVANDRGVIGDRVSATSHNFITVSIARFVSVRRPNLVSTRTLVGIFQVYRVNLWWLVQRGYDDSPAPRCSSWRLGFSVRRLTEVLANRTP